MLEIRQTKRGTHVGSFSWSISVYNLGVAVCSEFTQPRNVDRFAPEKDMFECRQLLRAWSTSFNERVKSARRAVDQCDLRFRDCFDDFRGVVKSRGGKVQLCT